MDTPQKSEGHIGFTETHEYYWVGNGDGIEVHKAPISNPIGTNGQRSGRFESTKQTWKTLGHKLVVFRPA
jgi:hypothetical protein